MRGAFFVAGESSRALSNLNLTIFDRAVEENGLVELISHSRLTW